MIHPIFTPIKYIQFKLHLRRNSKEIEALAEVKRKTTRIISVHTGTGIIYGSWSRPCPQLPKYSTHFKKPTPKQKSIRRKKRLVVNNEIDY